jgi:hypothetical protein
MSALLFILTNRAGELIVTRQQSIETAFTIFHQAKTGGWGSVASIVFVDYDGEVHTLRSERFTG